MIVATASAWFGSLSVATRRARQQLRTEESIWRTLTQELAETQAEREALTAKVDQLQIESRGVTAAVDPVLASFLLSKEGRPASPETQEKILAEFGRGRNSSAGYVLVSKAALRTTALRPLKPFPESHRLSEVVCSVLAITPEEQQSVEAAFAQTFEKTAAWAKANVQRDGPSENMLVRYTLPADPEFERVSTEKLFSAINATLGKERGELMRGYFEHFRVYEDGAMGNRTNILEIHRTPGQSTLGYRSGWKWENSEAINTYPEPIAADKFPACFFFVFPGGWQEVAQRESFDLPEGVTESSKR
ncbi:MAG TPA: hypothetical protein VN673_10205 [Clostridia bacterium]|nr:hypothetical protein [Clostridia bacterium]